MNSDDPACIDLDKACEQLAKSKDVRELVRKTVGDASLEDALQMMHDGCLEGEVGATVHDLLTDTIANESETVWDGTIGGEYPVQVNEYHGVYWVWAMEYDPVGYFTSKKEAIGYVQFNWDAVRSSGAT